MTLFSMWLGSSRMISLMVPRLNAVNDNCPPLSPSLVISMMHLSISKNQFTALMGFSSICLSEIGFMFLIDCIL